jgi:hypothetical protein
MELTYHRKGEYLFPNLVIGEQAQNIGKYGMLRKTYLKENRSRLYQSLLISGKLDSHLLEIEKSAEERMELLTQQLLKQYPAPDKALDQLKWTAHMNSLNLMAEESVLKELVYS